MRSYLSLLSNGILWVSWFPSATVSLMIAVVGNHSTTKIVTVCNKLGILLLLKLLIWRWGPGLQRLSVSCDLQDSDKTAISRSAVIGSWWNGISLAITCDLFVMIQRLAVINQQKSLPSVTNLLLSAYTKTHSNYLHSESSCVSNAPEYNQLATSWVGSPTVRR